MAEKKGWKTYVAMLTAVTGLAFGAITGGVNLFSPKNDTAIEQEANTNNDKGENSFRESIEFQSALHQAIKAYDKNRYEKGFWVSETSSNKYYTWEEYSAHYSLKHEFYDSQNKDFYIKESSVGFTSENTGIKSMPGYTGMITYVDDSGKTIADHLAPDIQQIFSLVKGKTGNAFFTVGKYLDNNGNPQYKIVALLDYTFTDGLRITNGSYTLNDGYKIAGDNASLEEVNALMKQLFDEMEKKWKEQEKDNINNEDVLKKLCQIYDSNRPDVPYDQTLEANFGKGPITVKRYTTPISSERIGVDENGTIIYNDDGVDHSMYAQFNGQLNECDIMTICNNETGSAYITIMNYKDRNGKSQYGVMNLEKCRFPDGMEHHSNEYAVTAQNIDILNTYSDYLKEQSYQKILDKWYENHPYEKQLQHESKEKDY